jgi:hypothetical protein
MASTPSEPIARELSAVTVQLRRMTRVVDRLREVAMLGSTGGRAMQLDEASRALHQALLAIDEATLPVTVTVQVRS